MIVYNSMIVMVLVLTVIYHIQRPDTALRLSRPIPWPYAILAMGYIIFWAAMRSGFIDTKVYIGHFENAPTGIEEAFELLDTPAKSPTWNFLQSLFKTCISTDYHWWFATIALISGVPIMLVFRKKSVDYLFSVYLFTASTTFSWMFNGIRQFVVAAIAFGFYFLLVEKKRLLFIGIILLLSLIHSTILIMLPAVFFVDCKPFGKMMSLFVIIILISAFFMGSVTDTMDELLQDTTYHHNLDQFEKDDGANPLRVLFESVPVLMAFIKRREIAATNNTFLNLCINMSTVAAGIYYIAMLTSGIMIGRLPIYFSLYNFILIPYLINFFYTSHRRELYLIFYIAYIIFYFYSTPYFYYVSDVLGISPLLNN